MELDIQKMIFEFIGGLGIFLFGIKLMGEGLQKSAGDKLRDILDKFTTNPIMGILAGIIVTVLIQSSSGTTVLTVGLVSAGFMTLRQAIGVIMGANIGTTITAFIIGIEIKEYALPIIFIGAVLLFFFKNNKVNSIGQIFFGFGALFFGLNLMGDGMKPLRSLETFHDLTVSMSDQPLLGVLIGTLFTVIVQSSSATIGILQELHGQGLIDLKAALPVLFGDNIGTTITAVLASIGASIAARRAALTHVIFNLIGSTIFLVLLPVFTSIIDTIKINMGLNPQMTIAFAHGIFNTTNTLMQAPFIAGLAWLVTKIIPGEDLAIEYKPKHLDPIFIEQSPSIAIGQAKEEVLRMGKFASVGLEEAKNYLFTKERKHAETTKQLEDAINNLDRKITEYLILLSRKDMSKVDSEQHSVLMDTVRDFERIGDHFENIVELVDYQISNKVTLTNQALEDINEMFDLSIEAVKTSMHALDDNDTSLASKVLKLEEKIDKLERSNRKKHILRINEGICTGQAGIIFVDIISNIERISDHCVNIAETVLEVRN
ncbi:Na/Pi cotransporter family protein [Bacillus sp. FJAT-47783]|uniref:Na/Pi cotransporter family protein n=1 Tax=Bacillus sp. FJAT-47783 TaxID=2922712 RepID=UPI001FAD409E|nr:Na/Pi cotransporter family protein [Bacillus sp. FJAT-47783]